MRKLLLNSFTHRQKLIAILKNQAKKSDFKEEWVMENWWVEDDGRGFFLLYLGEPKEAKLIAHILHNDVIEI